MTDLLATLRARADMVLIDTPPLLPVTDAAVLARECDGALVIIRQNRTTREQLGRALDALRSVDARVLGTVLNMAPAGGAGGYGYGYYAGEYTSRADVPHLIPPDAPPSGRNTHWSGHTRVG
jgi:Mrp family chromosome partitioning ATPase